MLDMSYVYLSTMPCDPLMYIAQPSEDVYSEHFLNAVSSFLLCWVPHRTLAAAMGIPLHAIDRAEQCYGFYVWATEFENVHSTWAFREPRLNIDGKEYDNSEHYYHSQKPVPWNKTTWDAMKIDVMSKGVWDKVLHVRMLLLST